MKWCVSFNGRTVYTTAPSPEKAVSNVRFKLVGKRPIRQTDRVSVKPA